MKGENGPLEGGIDQKHYLVPDLGQEGPSDAKLGHCRGWSSPLMMA